MNKYQAERFSSLRVWAYVLPDNKIVGKFNMQEKDSAFTVTQDEDISKNDYRIISEKFAFEFNVGGVWEKSKPDENNNYVAEFKYSTPITKIKILDSLKLVEPLIIDIHYIDADKEKYYAKKKEEEYKALVANAKIKHSTGDSIINVYFQPCCDKYAKTNIKLYIPDTDTKPETWSLIKSINVPEEDFFAAIANLAYGKYSYVLTQFAHDGTVLIKTDHVEVTLSRPHIGNGRNIISI